MSPGQFKYSNDRCVKCLQVDIDQTAKYGILDKISLVRDNSGWCGLWHTGAVRSSFDVVRCGLMQWGAYFTQCSAEM